MYLKSESRPNVLILYIDTVTIPIIEDVLSICKISESNTDCSWTLWSFIIYSTQIGFVVNDTFIMRWNLQDLRCHNHDNQMKLAAEIAKWQQYNLLHLNLYHVQSCVNPVHAPWPFTGNNCGLLQGPLSKKKYIIILSTRKNVFQRPGNENQLGGLAGYKHWQVIKL